MCESGSKHPTESTDTGQSKDLAADEDPFAGDFVGCLRAGVGIVHIKQAIRGLSHPRQPAQQGGTSVEPVCVIVPRGLAADVDGLDSDGAGLVQQTCVEDIGGHFGQQSRGEIVGQQRHTPPVILTALRE